jgi:diguanylate cyclase (GGDEF)-like protein
LGLRRARLSSARNPRPEQPFALEGRPKDSRKPLDWGAIFIRLLAIAWGGAVVAALLDAFGQVPHLPFITAIGMTGMLVAALFLWTQPVDEKEARRRAGEDEDDDTVYDLLTELPTFAHFQRRLKDEFTRSRRMGRSVSVVLIDVNNLTSVNKEYGVKAGDEVLRHVAKAVDNTRRYNDVVSRLGDDEFGVILLDTGQEGVNAFIDRLEDRLARESAAADVGGRAISLWAGICTGNAISSARMNEHQELLESAMESLNTAKQERERRRRTWLTA